MKISQNNININFKKQKNDKDASLILSAIPGAHQLVNGRTNVGAAFILGDIVLGIFAILLNKTIKNISKENATAIFYKDNTKKEELINKLSKLKKGYIGIGCAAVLLGFTNVYDAYKHPNKKVQDFIKKNVPTDK